MTSGGRMRQFEVLQSMQVGNAVPPILRGAVACILKQLKMKLDI